MIHMILNQHYLDFRSHGIRCQGGRSRPIVVRGPVQFHQVLELMVLPYFEADFDVLYSGFSPRIMVFENIL